MYQHFKVLFGPAVPLIRAQLKSAGLKADETHIDKWQSISDAIQLLASNGLLPNSQSFKCRQKLIRHMSTILSYYVVLEIRE